MPPSLAGETYIEMETVIGIVPGIVIRIVADRTSRIGLASYAVIRRLR